MDFTIGQSVWIHMRICGVPTKFTARIEWRNNSIVGPAFPYYKVSGVSYVIPHTALSVIEE